MSPKQILELINLGYLFYNEEITYLENGILKGLKLNNLNPALTHSEIIELLNFYGNDLKYLSIEGTIDCSIFEEAPLSNLTHLWLSSENVRNLDCLKFLPNLQSLTINAQNLRSLNGLKYAEKLKHLKLIFGNWRSLKPISQLKNLEYLFISPDSPDINNAHKYIPDVKTLKIPDIVFYNLPTARLKNFQTILLDDVYIDENKSENILSKLNTLTNIQSIYLTISTNYISLSKVLDAINEQNLLKELIIEFYYDEEKLSVQSIEKIKKFKNLETLEFYELLTNDLSPIQSLTNLKHLHINTFPQNLLLSQTQNKHPNHSLEFISKLRQLEHLSLEVEVLPLADINFLKPLKNLKTLELSHMKIKDFSAIQYLNNLEYLSLYSIQTPNLKGISKLTKLSTVEIRHSDIDDYSDLKAPNLLELKLEFSSPCNFNFLKELKNLQALYLTDAILCDFKFLQNLKKLKIFSLSQVKLKFEPKNINHIFSLPNLKALFIDNSNFNTQLNINELKNLLILSISKIDNPEKFKSIPQLRQLSINQQITNIDFLKHLPNLTALSLSLTPNTDLTPISKLKKLVYLELNNIDAKQLSFILKLPNIQRVKLSNVHNFSKYRSLIRKIQNKYYEKNFYKIYLHHIFKNS